MSLGTSWLPLSANPDHQPSKNEPGDAFEDTAFKPGYYFYFYFFWEKKGSIRSLHLFLTWQAKKSQVKSRGCHTSSLITIHHHCHIIIANEILGLSFFVWNCQILNKVVESQLFISLWNGYHQWFSDIEPNRISASSASYPWINPCFAAGKRIVVWKCQAKCG